MTSENKYRDIWILGEQYANIVQPITFELLMWGYHLKQQRKCNLNVMIFGDNISKSELAKIISHGADRVVTISHPELKYFLVETYAKCMISVINKYKPEVLLGGATSTGRTLLPYVAIKTHTGLTADCTVLEYEEGDTGNLLQTRPAIGGNIMATIKTTSHRPQMATVRPKSVPPNVKETYKNFEIITNISDDELNGKIINEPPPQILLSRIKHLDIIENEDEISIQNAEKVVVVGRGIKKPENIEAVKKFADKIGAALGATRDVVDRGWLSYPHQIGLSGKTITPKLYIGLGVSGAIQHLAGMQTSEYIIAVNTDPDAQIFKVADLGIIGDIFEVLPALTEFEC